MNEKSDVDILIEQCIQDTNREYLGEGFVDNVKAGLNGAKEWLKADARNSFKLRKKSDMKNDRRWSARKGKVASYAKSIANTLQDFKKQGGTLGRGIKVDEVISRLNQVAQGKYPRGKAQTTQQTRQTAEKKHKDTISSDTEVPTNSEVQRVQQIKNQQSAFGKVTSEPENKPNKEQNKKEQNFANYWFSNDLDNPTYNFSSSDSPKSNTNRTKQKLSKHTNDKVDTPVDINKQKRLTLSDSSTKSKKKTNVKGQGLIQKVKDGLAKKSRRINDAMQTGIKRLKDKIVPAKNRNKFQDVNSEIIDPEIIDNPTKTTTQTTSTALGPVKHRLSPNSKLIRNTNDVVIDAGVINNRSNVNNNQKLLALGNSSPESKEIEPLGLPAPIENTNSETKRPLSPRKKRHQRDHALGKERRTDKTERQNRNNLKSAAKSKQFQRTNKKPKVRPEAEEVITEYYNTEAQLSMLKSIR